MTLHRLARSFRVEDAVEAGTFAPAGTFVGCASCGHPTDVTPIVAERELRLASLTAAALRAGAKTARVTEALDDVARHAALTLEPYERADPRERALWNAHAEAHGRRP